jgi:hypothetical protein
MTDSLVLMPNTAALASQFLRAQPEVDLYTDGRVYTKLPRTKAYPLVRITRVGGRLQPGRPLWLETVTLQVDCFAGQAKTAHDLARICRAALGQRLPGSHEVDGDDIAAVVTDVQVGGITETDDPTEPEARSVARFDTRVTVHPQPSALTGS